MTQKDQNTLLKIIARSSIMVLISLALSKIFSYSYRIIIARYFGPEIYGLLSLALVVAGMFVAVFSLGFSEGVLRFFSIYRGKNENKSISYLFNFSYKTLIISSLVAAIISFSLSDFISIRFFHDPNMSFFLKVFSIMIPLWILGPFFLSIMRSFEKVKANAIAESILQNFSKLLWIVVLIYLGIGSNSVAYSFFIGILSMFVFSYFYCRAKIPIIFSKSKPDKAKRKEISKEFLSYSLPLMFFGIIVSLFYWIDSLAIGFFKSTTEVGFYNAVIPIALLLSLVPEIFLYLMFPIITKEYSKGGQIEKIKEITKQIAKWVFIINFPLFILIMLFPGVIINLLFGSTYLVATNALRFLIVGALFSSIFIISDKLLSMAGKSKLILMDIVLASILNIVLNILLVPKETIFGLDNALGINGAAIATMISVIFFNSLFIFQARHYTKIIPLRRKMLRVVLLSIFPTAFLLFVRSFIEIDLFFSILLSLSFFLIYTFLIFTFKALDKNDFMLLKAIREKVGSYKK